MKHLAKLRLDLNYFLDQKFKHHFPTLLSLFCSGGQILSRDILKLSSMAPGNFLQNSISTDRNANMLLTEDFK